MSNLTNYIKERLKDPYFRELYELDAVKTKIASKILGYRIKHNLSQTRLAKQVGVSQQQISNIE